ncbi:MAG: serine hydrolase domain-containing protein, partial [Pseudomonadota bacterium]
MHLFHTMVRMLVVSGLLAIAPAMAESNPHRLGEIARARMATDGVPGIVIVLIAGGEPVWTGAFGLADVATRRPMTADALFRVESISKPVTAWGAMRLAESGR